MPIGRRAMASLLLAAALPAARAQNVSKPWPAGRALPPLAATDLNGKAWDLSALRGRAVLINFWATWCAPCKEEMPTLQTLAELEGERLAVLAVNVREPLPRVRRYVQSSGLSLAVLPDPKGEITQAWGIKVFPTTVLIDASGRPRQVVSGAVDWTGAPALNWIKALGG
ncbi:MAG: TlpA disulfide reductase family protein [Burkholderiaceae bacterium]